MDLPAPSSVAPSNQAATPPTRLLTVREACVVLGISRASLYTLLGRGEIKVLRVGRRVLIAQTAIEAFIDGGTR